MPVPGIVHSYPSDFPSFSVITMIADRLAKNVKCPLMSGPVKAITRDDNSGNHEHDYHLFKAPCIGQECACAKLDYTLAENRPIRIIYCSFLNVQIGEIDATATAP